MTRTGDKDKQDVRIRALFPLSFQKRVHKQQRFTRINHEAFYNLKRLVKTQLLTQMSRYISVQYISVCSVYYT